MKAKAKYVPSFTLCSCYQPPLYWGGRLLKGQFTQNTKTHYLHWLPAVHNLADGLICSDLKYKSRGFLLSPQYKRGEWGFVSGSRGYENSAELLSTTGTDACSQWALRIIQREVTSSVSSVLKYHWFSDASKTNVYTHTLYWDNGSNSRDRQIFWG